VEPQESLLAKRDLLAMGRVQEAPERTWLSADQLPSKRHPQPKNAARKLQRQTVVLPPKTPPIPDSTEAVKPEGTQGNPRRLNVRRGGCLVAGPRHRDPDVLGQIWRGVWTAALSLVSFWMTSIMLSACAVIRACRYFLAMPGIVTSPSERRRLMPK
jgi:hypothetical protein